MTTGRKAGLIVAMLLTLLAIGLYVGLSRSHLGGWFDGYQCACGLSVYIHVKGDRYFQYAPGHHMPEHLCYNLRPHGDEWEAVEIRRPESAWSSLTKEGDVVARLRLSEGALYESWSGSTN